DLLLEAERKIATAIETLARNPAEVPHSGQRHCDQTIEKLVHSLSAQRHFAADWHVLSQLEGRDRPLGFGYDRMLSGNRGQVSGRGVGLLAVLHRLADAYVDHDLLQARHLHRVLV